MRLLLDRMVDKEVVDECFYPTYLVKKCFKGTWRLVEKKLTPGYLYVVSNDIERVSHVQHRRRAGVRCAWQLDVHVDVRA